MVHIKKGKNLKRKKKGKKSPEKRQGNGKEREGNGETGEILGVKEMGCPPHPCSTPLSRAPHSLFCSVCTSMPEVRTFLPH